MLSVFPFTPFFRPEGHRSPKANLSELLRPAYPRTHEDIGAGEQHVQAVQILPDPPVHGFGKPELPLDDQEGMFDHASHGRFPVLDLPFPVNARVVLADVQFRRFAADFVFDLRKMFVALDFVSLFNAGVS